MSRSDSASEAAGTQPVVLEGIAASPGLFKGPLFLLERPEVVVQVDRIAREDVPSELDRIREAFDLLTERLEDVAAMQDHPDAMDLAMVQLQMLQDPELRREIRRGVKRSKLPGDQAIIKAFNRTIRTLQGRNVPWATERAVDIASLRDQCISIYRNKEAPARIPEGSVVFAEELSMGELLQHGRERISALLLRKAGLTSHAVLVAQALGVPAVAGFRFAGNPIRAGQDVWVDGDRGQVVLNPDAGIDADMRQRAVERHQVEQRRAAGVARPSATRCGEPFVLRGNMEVEEELARLQEVRARGVGLLRTEALLAEPGKYSLEGQERFYRRVLEECGDDGATIRLFDVGGDKAFAGSLKELNPFLGWRGVRLLLDERHMLATQLQALLRVSGAFPGKLRILVPMVSEPGEMVRVRAMVGEQAARLQADGVPVDGALPIGAMIEVPSAALMTRSLARVSDFFSIGTNDLTQYTLAADRANAQVAHLYDPHHPAVWHLIKTAVDGAGQAGRAISVCGEMASRPAFAVALLGLGLRELSMPPSAIPAVKEAACTGSLEEFAALAEAILASDGIEEVKERVARWEAAHVD